MAFTRDLRVELAAGPGGTWTDVTGWLMQAGTPVTITRGKAPEDAKAKPSTCSLVLLDDGRFTPDNPTGAYYGRIGRNTPVRLSLRTVADSFSRTVASGWGVADTGHLYDLIGAGGSMLATDWQVAGGKGTQSVPVANAYRMSRVTGPTYRNVDVAVTATLAITDVTGASVEPANLVLRGSDSAYYFVRVVVTTDEAVTIELRHRLSSGTEVSLAGPVTVAGLTHSSSQALRVRAQAEGRTLRAKVWAESTGEPVNWHVRATDARITTAGWVGVRSGVSIGNTNTKPVVFSYDSLEVRRPRFCGESSSWAPSWDPSHRKRTVALKASGPLRRLGQGKATLPSAPRRYIPTSDPGLVAYWPLEDGPLSPYASPVVGPFPMRLFAVAPSSRHFGQGDLGPWLNKGVRMLGASTLTGSVSTKGFPAFSGQWCVDHVRAGEATTPTKMIIVTSTGTWSVEFLPTTSQVKFTWPTGNAIHPLTVSLWDGAVHHVRFVAFQDGPDTAFYLDVDGDPETNGTVVAFANGSVGSVSFEDLTAHTEMHALGHVAVYQNSRPLVEFAPPVLGRIGEPAGERARRLCAEEGVTLVEVGDLADTEPMGPQAPEPLLTLLDECAVADQGSLYEPAGEVGLAYRSRSSLYNQAAALTLDYSAEQVAPPLTPTDDDRHVRNDVAVKRRHGSEHRDELSEGPMSVQDPPDGVGRYDTTVTANLETDEQLPDMVGWLLHLGTVDRTRYPKLTIDLAAPSVDNITEAAVLDVDVDDRVTVTGLEDALIYGDLELLARGYTEVFRDAFGHLITFNAEPMDPYLVARADDDSYKVDSDTAVLNAGVTTSATTFSVAHGVGGAWTTDPAQMPIPLTIGGEDVLVTAVGAPAAGLQTMTVTRSVNGVAKAHNAGAPIRLTRRPVAAL